MANGMAKIDRNASGNGTALVAAPGAGHRVVVKGYLLVCAAAVSVKFVSGSTDLTGAMPFAANGGALPSDPGGVLYCGDNEALYLNLSAGVQVSGHLWYATESP